MTVLDVLADALRRLGAEHSFGLPGSGNFELIAAMRRVGIGYHGSAHEAGAVGMAEGYARVSGRVGVASVSQGPGLTNALTPLTESAKSRTPLLLLAVEAARRSLYANLQIDSAALLAALGVAVERVRAADTAAADVARAWRRAEVERRPVALLLPVDIQQEQAEPAQEPPVRITRAEPAWPAPDAISALASLLEAAERPVLIAGRGAMRAGAGEALASTAERVGALLATSAVAKGIFAGDPASLGISGSFASPLARELLPQADAVAAFGASLNVWTTFNRTMLSPTVRVAAVDVEEVALGRHHEIELGIVGDARATAEALIAELDRRGVRRTGFRTPAVLERIRGRRPADEFEDHSAPGRLDPRTLTLALEERLPAQRTVTIDSGHFMGWPTMYLSVPDAEGFVYPEAFQSVGLGIGIGIGAAVARPERLSVVALGDGGARMSMGELETAARHGLRLLFVVYDDAAYGAEVHRFEPRGLSVEPARFPDLDFAALASALGLEGATVRSVEDLHALERWLADPGGPLLLDCKIDPAVRGHWVAGNNRAAVS